MKKLWLDDIRKAPEGWDWAERAAHAIDMLTKTRYDVVSLDHDLGQDTTGYDVACWLELKAYRGEYVPKIIKCHSANPVGRSRIETVIKNIERIRK